MRIVSNDKSIQRNQTIARWTLIIGIAVLVLALFANLYVAVPMLGNNSPDAALTPQQSQYTIYSFIGLLLGYTLTTISTSLNSRYGRRPDKGLAAALRGNSNAYALFNYMLGASHVLVAPGGTYVLVPKYQSGPIQYANGKWKHAGQSTLSRIFLRQDVLGNPRRQPDPSTASMPPHYSAREFRPRMTSRAHDNSGARPAGPVYEPYSAVHGRRCLVARHSDLARTFMRKILAVYVAERMSFCCKASASAWFGPIVSR